MAGKLRKRTFFKHYRVSYHWFRRKGMLRFVLIKTLQVLAFLAVLVIAFNILEKKFVDVDIIFDEYMSNLNPYLVLGVFTLSESFMGLLPPDFFIIWADQHSLSILILTIVGILSYVGGLNSYWIGRGLNKFGPLSRFVEKKYSKYDHYMKKWGNLFISIAAFFPLPFSPIGMLMGMVKYPFKSYTIFTLTRILRFYVHGVILFNLI